MIRATLASAANWTGSTFIFSWSSKWIKSYIDHSLAQYGRLCTHENDLKSKCISTLILYCQASTAVHRPLPPCPLIHFPSPLILHFFPRCRALSCKGAGDGHCSSLRVKAGVQHRSGCQLDLPRFHPINPKVELLALGGSKSTWDEQREPRHGNLTLSPVTSTAPPFRQNLH